ncbi:Peroxidase [Bertholletia excelsa]
MRPSFVVFPVLLMMLSVCNGGKLINLEYTLNIKYYHRSCPSVEKTVRDITWSKVAENPALAAKLLRLHYHDCFVRGCDASILLDSTKNNTAEKAAPPNQSISGYDVIDDIKVKLEEDCPGTVSCADIVALAARDAVSFQFGRPMWPVLTGRRDGMVSLAPEVGRNLPLASANFSTLQSLFESKGLDLVDLVALSGAHTIGVAHCGVFIRRLYNFTGRGDADPSLDPDYAKILRIACPNPPNQNTTVEMDPSSSLSFDSHYYVTVRQNKGLFGSDAALLTDPRSAHLVWLLQNPYDFFRFFARSMLNMGAVGALTGSEGEVRRNCRLVN